MKKAIIVLSGGLYSCVAASYAKKENYELHALFFDYGQKALENEKNSAEKISKFLNAKFSVISLEWMKNLKSGLISGDIPKIVTIQPNKKLRRFLIFLHFFGKNFTDKFYTPE